MRDENEIGYKSNEPNLVHKSDNDYNQKVVKTKKLAENLKNPRDFIDCLAGGKTLRNVNDRVEWQMPEEEQEIVLANGDPEPLVVSRIESVYKEMEEDER